MTELKYRHDPPLVKGLYSVYMAGSIECAFSQHQDCMEIDGCLFHKGASTHNITRKGIKSLRRRCGLDGKSRKRLRKKEEQVINRRDRRFRDRTRKLRKLLKYQIESLEFVFQGPPFGDKDPKISMYRRYAFPDAPNRMIEHIRNNALDFLGLQQ